MADGRMLSKRVTRSNKIAALSSDTARMIYSWLIPYTDVEGRMEADPRLLKADIAPLLDHITPGVINSVLQELHKIGLIVIYSVGEEDKLFLEITKFEENQKNLRKDREAPSRIPAPNPEKVRRRSGEGPAELPPNIREEKLREAKEAREDSEPVDNSLPVDNSKPALLEKDQDKEKEPDALMMELREVTEEIGSVMPDAIKHRQMMVFVEANIRGSNHNAMLHCLKSMRDQLKKGEQIEKPRAYLDAALKIENGKHNARENEERSNQFKVSMPNMSSIGDIFRKAAQVTT